MAFSKIINENGGEVVLLPGGQKRKVATFYGLTTDGFPEDHGEIPENADKLYYMDWKELSAEEKSKAKAQVWMYDENNKKWRPQF